jgi:UDP-N-acetyl-D-mannosaminuronic acid dehydrogenase
MLKVCMIGLGYIGLPTAATMASRGYKVLGIDVNQHAVDTINAGDVHIVEPDLDMLVRAAVTDGKLIAKTAITKSDQCDIYMIAVPTPFKEGKQPDLSYVKAAVETLAPFLKKGDCVILESTSPVGSTAKIAGWLTALRPDLSLPVENIEGQYDISIAYCPERVLPGKVLHEIVHNDRIIGGLTKACADKVHNFYKSFVQGECLKTKARTAAMCKLTENAYRDVNIAFANELSMICDEQGIDVWELRELANRHPRVNVLKPGPGVGGHCIAVDPWFIVDASPERSRLIKTAREVNDYKPHYLVEQIQRKLQYVETPRILCLGLSYKPNVDDLRESPAIEVVKLLAKNYHYDICVCEPHVDALPNEFSVFSNLSLCDYDSLEMDGFDHVVKLVEHDGFMNLKRNQVEKEELA